MGCMTAGTAASTRWPTIAKNVRALVVPPNLVDYDETCAGLTWDHALAGLAGNRGLNIAHDAVIAHYATGHFPLDLRFVASVGEPLNPEVVVWGQEAFGQPVPVNWWQTEGSFQPRAAVHLGVAVALRQGGLVAPALHDADTLVGFGRVREEPWARIDELLHKPEEL